jgi:hypothetical protein
MKLTESKLRSIIREELAENFNVSVGKNGRKTVQIQDVSKNARMRMGAVAKMRVENKSVYLKREQVHNILDALEQYA